MTVYCSQATVTSNPSLNFVFSDLDQLESQYYCSLFDVRINISLTLFSPFKARMVSKSRTMLLHSDKNWKQP